MEQFTRQRDRSLPPRNMDDRSRSRKRRRREDTSPPRRRRSRRRTPNDCDNNSIRRRRHRHRSAESDRRQQRRHQRRRRSEERSRPRRRRSNSSESQSPPRVSDDDVDQHHSTTNLNTKRRSSALSSRDDTVGHFRGLPGTVIDKRFRVIRDVGMGTFGRVVECIDLKDRRQDWRVAIKIVRSVKRYYDSALVEAKIVNRVNRRGGRGTSHCAILFDSFTWSSHYCMVFENLGLSLYDFMKQHKYQPFPPCCVRDFATQLLEALEFLHSFGLIHTDLKPENILLSSCREIPYLYGGRTYQIPESTKIKVIDFGGATYDDEKKSSIVATRQYRAPEVILDNGWSMPSDMWSAGCIIAELYRGELLFATHDNIEHLALMEQIIGPFPRKMLQRAKNSDMVEETFHMGRHRLHRVLSKESAKYVETMKPLNELIPTDDRPLYQLLRRLLEIDPGNRATGHESARFRLN